MNFPLSFTKKVYYFLLAWKKFVVCIRIFVRFLMRYMNTPYVLVDEWQMLLQVTTYNWIWYNWKQADATVHHVHIFQRRRLVSIDLPNVKYYFNYAIMFQSHCFMYCFSDDMASSTLDNLTQSPSIIKVLPQTSTTEEQIK